MNGNAPMTAEEAAQARLNAPLIQRQPTNASNFGNNIGDDISSLGDTSNPYGNGIGGAKGTTNAGVGGLFGGGTRGSLSDNQPQRQMLQGVGSGRDSYQGNLANYGGVNNSQIETDKYGNPIGDNISSLGDTTNPYGNGMGGAIGTNAVGSGGLYGGGNFLNASFCLSFCSFNFNLNSWSCFFFSS
jgi:hypothetical protein